MMRRSQGEGERQRQRQREGDQTKKEGRKEGRFARNSLLSLPAVAAWRSDLLCVSACVRACVRVHAADCSATKQEFEIRQM
jgi:hypothetical protein